jgi:hypothetical protein
MAAEIDRAVEGRSWPIQTPSWTSALIAQPTEQNVQIVVLTSMLEATGVWADALRWTAVNGRLPSPRPLAGTPERCRKARRSRPAGRLAAVQPDR